MRNTGRGYVETARDRQRQKDRDLSIKLMIPGAVILLPLFYFIAWSVATGKDQFGPLRDFVSGPYAWIALIVVFAAVIPMLYALYLTIIKDMMELREAERNERIIAKFAPMYRYRASRGEIIAFFGFIAAVLLVVGFVVYIHVF